MTVRTFFRTLLPFLVLFPSAASCYFSMAHQMRFPVRKTALLCGAVLVPYSLAAAYVCARYHLYTNALLLPSLVPFCLLFQQTVTSSVPKTLSAYVGVCAVQSFPLQFAHALDAHLHPDSGAFSCSTEALLFQLALSCLIAAAAAYPAIRRFSHMVDQLDVPSVWYTLIVLSSVFLVFNIIAIPRSYQTVLTGRMGYLFPALELCLLALLWTIYVLFYRTSQIIVEWEALQVRSYLLETQARQYSTLRTHLRETARLRHDFRHSVHLLSTLARQGDLEKLRAYLAEYEGQLAEAAPVNYCTSDALNALFSYYQARAGESHIRTDWRISLPDPLCFSELDLTALFGNLMENAVAGCQSVPAQERYFFLTAQVQRDGALYIVSSNSFDGRVRTGRTGYLSTKHAGEGLGLPSIAAVAEKYGGSSRVSHSDTAFFVDVMMRADAR